MNFPTSSLDLTIEEHLDRLHGLLAATRTAVYLDTSILAYCYRLHSSARAEVYEWFASLQSEDRLFVPAWVVQEYTATFKSEQLSTYAGKNKAPEDVLRQLDALFRDASMYVDDATVKKYSYQSRDDYLRRFQEGIASIKSAVTVLRKDLDVYSIHDELASVVSKSVLATDLSEVLEAVSAQGAMRFSHRLAPGYLDQEKPHNQFGDLVIWLEILSHCEENEGKFASVVILSNDEKKDWCYAPKRRTLAEASGRKFIPNRDPEIRLADPYLVAELAHSCSSSDLVITNIALAIEALSKQWPTRFASVSQAVQSKFNEPRNDIPPTANQSGNSGDVTIDVPHTLVKATEASTARTSKLELQLQANATRDGLYKGNPKNEIDALIADLRTHDWYRQNPAIDRINGLKGKEFDNESWFVLGRNIYQAACGNATKAIQYAKNLDWFLRDFSDLQANLILGGMTFEIYFDSHGSLRGHCKTGQIDPVLAELLRPRYSPAVHFVRAQLKDADAVLRYLPGAKTVLKLKMKIRVTAASSDGAQSGEIQSLRLESKELLKKEEKADADDLRWKALGRRMFKPDEVKQTISKRACIPLYAIALSVIPKDAENAFVVPPEDFEIDYDVL